MTDEAENDEEGADDADEDGIAEADDADEEAEWLTGALLEAFQSVAVLAYSFSWSGQTDAWLLLRRDAFGENPEVIAEYPGDDDFYQMFYQAVAAVDRNIAESAEPKGSNGNPSVYRRGL